MKQIAVLVAAGLLSLTGVLLGRTVVMVQRQRATTPVKYAVDVGPAARRLAGALKHPTVSSAYGDVRKTADAQRALLAHLRESFPRVFNATEVTEFPGGSVMLIWRGHQPTAPAVLLLGHTDVVDVPEDVRARWVQPPFGGVVADGAVWGRGALDCKSVVLAILEAVDALLEAEFMPDRDVIMAFGHDEEVGGMQGARQMAATLESQGVGIDFVIDEGLPVSHGVVPGVVSPVAMVGIAEKGYVSIELTTRDDGGHASIPTRPTVVGRLAAAVAALQSKAMPARIQGPSKAFLEHLGPEMSLGKRVVIANLWLFGPFVKYVLSKKPATDALVRTTTAPTVINGGTQENVLPSNATAVVNYRIAPGDSIDAVVAHVRDAVRDPLVEVRLLPRLVSEPSPVSPIGGHSFEILARTIREVFPEVVVAPALTLAATDSRHYMSMTENVYRFAPQRVRPDDIVRYHGDNERITVGNYAEMITFYRRLIENVTAMSEPLGASAPVATGDAQK